jgi:hypothetical protein
MDRLREIAREYLEGEIDARAFRSKCLAIIYMLNDNDTHTLSIMLTGGGIRN